jgi:hypothetical protein
MLNQTPRAAGHSNAACAKSGMKRLEGVQSPHFKVTPTSPGMPPGKSTIW